MNRGISVVINTLNEEKNLPFALRSVMPWADEIVVVDMHSQDDTVDIARQYGARVCLHEGPGVNLPPREFSVAQANYEWVFVLDADEVAPLALSQDLRRIADSDDADVAALPRRNFVMGAALKGTGWGPTQDYQTRFFKKGKIRAHSIAHHEFIPAECARVLRLPYNGRNAIVHFSYLDSAHFIQKLNQYTSIEAIQRLERHQHASFLKVLLYAARVFLFKYLKGGGYRDGWRGLYVACFMVVYRLATYAKLQELESVGKTELVEKLYRQEAEMVISEYEQAAATVSRPLGGS
jgi:glycosyltransferase involved in cell wall biosynthesis